MTIYSPKNSFVQMFILSAVVIGMAVGVVLVSGKSPLFTHSQAASRATVKPTPTPKPTPKPKKTPTPTKTPKSTPTPSSPRKGY